MFNKPHRLKTYDYSADGIYYITINSKNRKFLFGEIAPRSERVLLNDAGVIVEEEWFKTAILRPDITLGEYTIMPDHFHGLITIGNPKLPEFIPENMLHFFVPHTPNFRNKFGPQFRTLGRIIGSLKAACKKRITEHIDKQFQWQVSFYDVIIRDLASKARIEEYIRNNINHWEGDT